MKLPRPFPKDFSEASPPLQKGDTVYIHHDFSNGIGGKRAIVQGCYPNAEMTSGWAVKIDKYQSPIDSEWLIKIPQP